MKRAATISLLFVFLFSLSFVLAAPEITNLGFDSYDGVGFKGLDGNAEDGFILVTDNNSSTDFEVDFTTTTNFGEILKSEMFPLILVNSTTPIQDLKDYYTNRGVPEPFLTYLKDAADGTNPFAYINGSKKRLNDAAKADILSQYVPMTIPGDYPPGIYTVNGTIKNQTDAETNVSFKLIIGVYILNKTNANLTCSPFETENITISADIVGDIDSVWFSYNIDGINYNETPTNTGKTYTYTIPSSLLVGGQNVTWNVYSNDSIGRLYNNSWKTFYVRSETNLTIDPSSPDGLNGWYVTEPVFSFSKDASGGNIYYEWDSDDILLYTLPFNLDNIPNAPPKESAGILELNWWTDFNTCGNETMLTKLLYIDLIDPLITDLQPANASEIYETKPLISAYLDEIHQSNSGINISTIILKVDNVEKSANIFLADTIDAITNFSVPSDLSLGRHNITINITDNAGRNSELSWYFDVAVLPVNTTLTINSPENKIYEKRRVPFNITSNKELEKIEYMDLNARNPKFRRLCRNCEEYGFTRARLKSFNEGNSTITIRATEKDGKIIEENITLTIETKAPRISRALPRKNSFTNGSVFYIKYNEENPTGVSLYLNGTNSSKMVWKKCTEGRNQECVFNNINLSEFQNQTIDYWFFVEDIVGNNDTSKVTPIKVDILPPVINSVTGTTDFRRHRINIKANVTEENFESLQYMDTNDKPKWKTICRRLDKKEGTCEKSIRFKGVTPEIIIRALDRAGNSAERII
jgi:hypothetical protein